MMEEPQELTQDELDAEERKRTRDLTLSELAALGNADGLARLEAISDEEWDAAQAADDQAAAEQEAENG